jgi:hypothetical protein
VTEREERLLALEVRAERRRKRRKATAFVAYGFGRDERGALWTALAREADALRTRLWVARVEAGAERWREQYRREQART